MGARVKVLPGTKSNAETVLACEPNGIFLSSGPGDPNALPYLLDTIRTLMGKKLPIFGVALGAQLLAAAAGAKSFKMKLGHHGSNLPVYDLASGKVEITTQNHNFAIDETSLPADWTVTHKNLHDETIEGIKHKTLPFFGLQYYPEPSAGPEGSKNIFEIFRDML